MTPVAPSDIVTRYLDRLSIALAAAPVELRDEIMSGIGEELAGLNDEAAASRIEQLGDPAVIAAEALGGVVTDTETAPTAPPKSSGYLIATVLLLVVGGYVVAGIGWVVGIALVFASSVWSLREKRIAVGTSIGAVLLATALLFLLRGSEVGLMGFIAFWAIPFLTNFYLGVYLVRRWRAHA